MTKRYLESMIESEKAYMFSEAAETVLLQGDIAKAVKFYRKACTYYERASKFYDMKNLVHHHPLYIVGEKK